MFCSSTSSQVRVVGVGKIEIRRNNVFATDESRTSNDSGGLVNFLVY